MDRFDHNEYDAVREVLEQTDKTLSYYSFSYLGEGGQVYNFEKEFAKWQGRKYAVAVNSGTSALFVAIKALMTPLSRQVAIPAYTFVADAEGVIQAGLNPSFADIDRNTWCMNEFNPNNSMFIPVHTLGNAVDCDVIKFWKNEVGANIIEDCAQAVGTKWKNKRVGNFGDIAIYSFQGTKTITTGEGGMLIMDSKDLYDKCCAIRNHGDYYRDTPYVGYNFRMSELPAAIGRCQLRKVEAFLESFKHNAKIIIDLLPNGIEPPFIMKEVTHGYFIIGCTWTLGKKRAVFLDSLQKARSDAGMLYSKNTPDIPGNNQPPGYSIGAGYRKPLYNIPIYETFKRACQRAEKVIDSAIWIDIHRWTEEDKIHKEMDIFNSVYRTVV